MKITTDGLNFIGSFRNCKASGEKRPRDEKDDLFDRLYTEVYKPLMGFDKLYM
ncbi:MAG: hypothetical protein LBP79_07275 [Clostridiales bacterium]|nr:hypothetical protein [Clostridiales bacterium]